MHISAIRAPSSLSWGRAERDFWYLPSAGRAGRAAFSVRPLMRALNTRTAHGALLAAVCAALACCAPAAAAPGDISTVAGTSVGFAGDGRPAIAAQLSYPYSVAPTPDGGFLVADDGNDRVRKVSAAG